MNAPTRSPASAKPPVTFARMLVLAQRRFDARRLPPAGSAASTASSPAAMRRAPARADGLAATAA